MNSFADYSGFQQRALITLHPLGEVRGLMLLII